MGKYMRKCSRGIGEVAVMEVTQPVGVRTRAQALALAAASGREANHGAGPKKRKVEAAEFRVSYIQLRSRSLSLSLTQGKSRRAAAASDSSATSGSSSASAAAAGNSGAGGLCSGVGGAGSLCSGVGGAGEWDRASTCSSNTSGQVLAAAAERASSRSRLPAAEVDDGSETTACNYDGDLQKRWREATPSSEPPERESDDLESTAKPAESGGRRSRPAASTAAAGDALRMPPEAEIEEFFAAAEKQEWKRFAEKYNYDVVKDVPLEGRYEWVQIKP